ncbi:MULTISPECIES: hypothetical protein [unclassified Paenibacillus]|uniref:hypothetical protein n=1 Tax=unclassified Paenibacillus TaxID=185978 RepID=UPI001C10AED1|nr:MULTISPECIES: hypothetical protein [unclassified Paenibacillus]MBU5443529.1 hypothetical protein [Paenibacillus sp. MSJ-34]CAH0120564.1 hypothetical protein PAE9249_03083 [Paenibacillus sp. CECT 9249]
MKRRKSDGFEWAGQDPFFKNNVPFNGLGDNFSLDMSSIENYVKDVLNRVSTMNIGSGETQLSCEVFETHHFVFVRIRIPKQINPKSLRIFLNTFQVKIEGLPGGREQMIKLPAPVVSMESRALYKEPYLQIKIPKLPGESYDEVYVRYS